MHLGLNGRFTEGLIKESVCDPANVIDKKLPPAMIHRVPIYKRSNILHDCVAFICFNILSFTVTSVFINRHIVQE